MIFSILCSVSGGRTRALPTEHDEDVFVDDADRGNIGGKDADVM